MESVQWFQTAPNLMGCKNASGATNPRLPDIDPSHDQLGTMQASTDAVNGLAVPSSSAAMTGGNAYIAWSIDQLRAMQRQAAAARPRDSRRGAPLALCRSWVAARLVPAIRYQRTSSTSPSSVATTASRSASGSTVGRNRCGMGMRRTSSPVSRSSTCSTCFMSRA